MPGDDVIEFTAALVDLPRLDEDVLRQSVDSAERLVDHHAGVGERAAFTLCTGAEEDAAHRRGHDRADGRDVRTHELHGVVDAVCLSE